MKRKSIISVLFIFLLVLAGCSSSKVKLPAQSEVTDKTLKDVFAEHGMK